MCVGKPVGETVLFFGCRTESDDFIYQEELQEVVDDGLLTVGHILSFEHFEYFEFQLPS